VIENSRLFIKIKSSFQLPGVQFLTSRPCLDD
jgi:hypothetical protein